MTDYPIGMELVVDPDNPMNVVANGSVGIYAPEDTAGVTLLPLKDLNGFPLANPLTSNAYGFTPGFLAPLPQVRWKSGEFSNVYNSYIGLRDEAVAAKNAAQDAQGAAGQAASDAAEAVGLALGPTDQQVDEGITRANIPEKVAAVVPSQVQELVPGLVAAAIAADNTPAQAAAAAVDTALGEAGVLHGAYEVESDDVAVSITDKFDRRSWLEANHAGGPTVHASNLIREALDALVTGPAPMFVGWGTSMMFGSTGNGTTLLTVIASELGIPASNFANMGRGGMLSPGIAARQGGEPAILTVAGGQIPASGGVNVNAGTKHVSTFQYWNAGGAYAGTLAGVPGSITYPNLTATTGVDAVFTRTTPGDAVKLYGPRPFLPTAHETHAGKPAILWIGRNNITDQNQVIADYHAMVDDIGHKNIIILSELDGTGVDTMNDRLAAEFPHYFVDLKAWLIANGLANVGITPTANDTADMAAGLVPRSLMVDLTHLNASGYTAAGRYVASIIEQKGWV